VSENIEAWWNLFLLLAAIVVIVLPSLAIVTGLLAWTVKGILEDLEMASFLKKNKPSGIAAKQERGNDERSAHISRMRPTGVRRVASG
jgi:hypothetical protein